MKPGEETCLIAMPLATPQQRELYWPMVQLCGPATGSILIVSRIATPVIHGLDNLPVMLLEQ